MQHISKQKIFQDVKKIAAVSPSRANSDETALEIMPTMPIDLPLETFKKSLKRREENRKVLLQWIRENLKAQVDYGKIHLVGKDKCQYARNGNVNDCPHVSHWSKPSLRKPGAEKIAGLLGLTVHFPNLHKYEDAAVSGRDIHTIILKCEIRTPSGTIMAEGTGARRVMAQDNGDINKSIKMASKSAQIDATLRAVGLSEVFTQDLEDMTQIAASKHETTDVNRYNTPNMRGYNQHLSRNNSNPNNHPQPSHENGSGRLSQKQYSFIMFIAHQQRITNRELNDRCLKTFGSVLAYISKDQASNLITELTAS